MSKFELGLMSPTNIVVVIDFDRDGILLLFRTKCTELIFGGSR